MNSFKEDEQALIEEFENILKETMPNHKNIKYSYYDIENESINLLEGNKCLTDHIDSFLNKLDSIFNIFKFFAIYFNSTGNKSIVDQLGIIRTNCLDCTERTNTMQSRIAWKVFANQMALININVNSYMLLEINDLGNLNLDESFKNVIFPSIWKENNEMLAKQYMGDDDEDGFKQRVIDILLQRFSVKFSSVNNDILKKELEAQIDKYTVNEELSIFIGSWNVGGSRLQEEISLLDWLWPKHKLNKGEKLEKTPDIYCIGCQEIVELSAGNIILTSNDEKVKYWKNCIGSTLDLIDK